jgi:hypothetical protein
MMHQDIIIAGFGGQGILSAGRLLAFAGMLENKNVSWLPSYGPEMRGGTANCHVIISDKPVGSPILNSATALIVMNGPSLDKFEKLVEKGGIIITDSSLVYRCEAKFTALYGPSLPLINNEEMARTSKEAIIKYLGKEVYMPFDAPGMGSESFSFLAAYYPSAMGNVGCRNEEKGITANAHDPHFEVDEDCLPYGAATYVAVALEYLNEGIEIPFTPFDGNADDLMVYIDRPVPPRYDILKTNHRKGV